MSIMTILIIVALIATFGLQFHPKVGRIPFDVAVLVALILALVGVTR